MTNLPGYAFTICAVAERGRTAAKTIRRRSDGTLRKREYDNVTFWNLIPLTPESSNANLRKVARYAAGEAGERANTAMAVILRTLAGVNDVMIVMGAPRAGYSSKMSSRRLWASALLTEPNTLFAVPRAWLAIDADDVEVPHGYGDGDRLAEAGTYIRDSRLPPEFAGVECVVAASASSGLMGPALARFRLFFLLDQPFELARLRSWGLAAQRADLPIDPSILQPGQPIYTSRPIFESMDDPVPETQWAFVLPGVTERVSLVAERYDAISAMIERKVNAAAAVCGDDWRRLLEATLGGPTGFFAPLSKALGVAARSADSDAEIAAAIGVLLAERADFGRQGRYSGGG